MNAVPASDPKIQGVAQIHVRARDMDRAVAYYRDVLALPFLFRAGNLAFFRCGDVTLYVGLPESPRFDHSSSILYFQVADIHESHRALAARGVVFEGEPHVVHKASDHDLWMAFFTDSEGNFQALHCRKPRG